MRIVIFGAGWTETDAPEPFRVLRDGRLAVLMIDRPAKRNALTRDAWAALPGILAGLTDTRVLIITGAGDSFSAGADVVELREAYADAEHARAYHAINVAAESAVAAYPHPTIAAVNGACVGGGCQLAVACDIRIAARGARIGVTPAKLGVIYPAVPTARLVGLVGPARAKYLLYSADLIDASRAMTYGLVDDVVDDALDAAVTLARTIAGRSPQSIGAVAAVIDALASGSDPAAAIVPWERDPTDVHEGLAAFIERRPPTFAPQTDI
jgi:enoyl-CoA hydratase/carnithine racemase